MQNVLLKTGYIVAVIGSLLVLNQYFGRFYLNTDVLGPLTPSNYFEAELAIFASHKKWYVLYVLSIGGALFTGPNILRYFSTPKMSPSFVAFIGSCILAAVSGLVISQHNGPAVLGGYNMMFYWAGLAFVMLVAVSMVIYAWVGGYVLMLRDWLIHLYSLSSLPLTIFPMVYLWQWTLGLNIHEAMATAVTIAFTGHFFISYFITIQILGKK